MNLARLAFPQPHQCFEGMEIARSEAFEFGNLLLRLRVLAHWLLSFVMSLGKQSSLARSRCNAQRMRLRVFHSTIQRRSAHDANSGQPVNGNRPFTRLSGFCQSNGCENLILGTENNANINYAEGASRSATALAL